MQALVTSVLKKVLSDYVTFPGQANILSSGWSAEMVFNNLAIRESVFDMLLLPVELKTGFIDRLKLKVQWAAILSNPAELEIDGITLVIVPRKSYPTFDEHKRREELRELKKAKLDAWEGVAFSDPDQAVSTVASIINNLKIKIKNVHVRIEAENGNSLMSFGFGLDEISIFPTDAAGNIVEKITSAVESALLHKMSELKGLFIYLNTTAIASKMVKVKRAESVRGNDVSFTQVMECEKHHDYLLKPFSARLNLNLDQSGTVEFNKAIDPESIAPKLDAKLRLGAVEIELSHGQYRNLFRFLDEISDSQEFIQKKFFELDSPNSMLNESEQASKYINLYKTKLQVGNDFFGEFTPAVSTDLLAIEDSWPATTINEWRSLCVQGILDQYGTDVRVELRKAKGVISSWFSASETFKSVNLLSGGNSSVYDQVAEHLDWERKITVTRMSLEWDELSLALCGSDGVFITKAITKSASANVGIHLKSGGVDFCGSIGSFSINDFITPHPEFSEVIKQIEESSSDLLSISFNQSTLPKNTGKVSRIQANMEPVNILATTPFINSIIEFFKPEKSTDMELLKEAAIAAAQAALGAASQASEVAVGELVEENSWVEFDLVLNGPILNVVMNAHDKYSPKLALALGVLSASTAREDRCVEKGILECYTVALNSTSMSFIGPHQRNLTILEPIRDFTATINLLTHGNLDIALEHTHVIKIQLSPERITKLASLASKWGAEIDTGSQQNKRVATALLESGENTSNLPVPIESSLKIDLSLVTGGMVFLVTSDVDTFCISTSLLGFTSQVAVIGKDVTAKLGLDSFDVSTGSLTGNEIADTSAILKGHSFDDDSQFFAVDFSMSETEQRIFACIGTVSVFLHPAQLVPLLSFTNYFVISITPDNFDEHIESYYQHKHSLNANESSNTSAVSLNPTPDSKQLVVSASFGGLELYVLAGPSKREITSAKVSGLHFNMTRFGDLMDVVACIDVLVVEDCTLKAGHLHRLVVFSGSGVNSERITQWDQLLKRFDWEDSNCKMDENSPMVAVALHMRDSSALQIGFRINECKVVFLNRFVKELLCFLSDSPLSKISEVMDGSTKIAGSLERSRKIASARVSTIGSSVASRTASPTRIPSDPEKVPLPLINGRMRSFSAIIPYGTGSTDCLGLYFEGFRAFNPDSSNTVEVQFDAMSVLVNQLVIFKLPRIVFSVSEALAVGETTTVALKVSKCSLSLGAEHYLCFVDIFLGNISEYPTVVYSIYNPEHVVELNSEMRVIDDSVRRDISVLLPHITCDGDDVVLNLSKEATSKAIGLPHLFSGGGPIGSLTTAGRVGVRIVSKDTSRFPLSLFFGVEAALCVSLDADGSSVFNLKFEHARLERVGSNSQTFVLEPLDFGAKILRSDTGHLNATMSVGSVKVVLTYSLYNQLKSNMDQVIDSIKKLYVSSTEEESTTALNVNNPLWNGDLATDKETLISLVNKLEDRELALRSEVEQNLGLRESLSGSIITALVSMDELDVTLVNDCLGFDFDVPFLTLRAWDGDIRLLTFAGRSSISASVLAESRYYNYGIVAWEPMVEPFKITTLLWASSESTLLRVSFPEQVSLNFTHGMLDSVSNSLALLSSSPDEIDEQSSSKEEFYTFRFVNDSGFELCLLWSEGSDQVHIASATSYTSVGWNLNDKVVDFEKCRSLVVKILGNDDWACIRKVDATRVGTSWRYISGKEGIHMTLGVTVSIQNGIKQLRIHPMCCIVNKTGIDIVSSELDTAIPDNGTWWLTPGTWEKKNVVIKPLDGSWKFSETKHKNKDEYRFLTSTGESGESAHFVVAHETTPASVHEFIVRVPLAVFCLLPFDCEVRLTDSTGKIWTNMIRRGEEWKVLTINPHLGVSVSVCIHGIWTPEWKLSDRMVVNGVVIESEKRAGGLGIDLTLYSEFWVYNLTGCDKDLELSGGKRFPVTVLHGETDQDSSGEPSLFSFSTEDRKVRVRYSGCEWSELIPLDAVGLEMCIVIPEKNGEHLIYEVNIHSTIAPFPYSRTKLVHISPKYIFRSELGSQQVVHFLASNSPNKIMLRLGNDSSRPIHSWQTKVSDTGRMIRLRIEEDSGTTDWSASLCIDSVKTGPVKLRSLDGNSIVLVEMEVAAGTYSTWVIVRSMVLNNIPYRIENRSLVVPVEVRQKNLFNWQLVAPNTADPFFWDVPTEPKKVVSIRAKPFGVNCESQELHLSLDEFDESPTLLGSLQTGSRRLFVYSHAIGHVKIITVTENPITFSERFSLAELRSMSARLEVPKLVLEKKFAEQAALVESQADKRKNSDSNGDLLLVVEIIKARNLPSCNWASENRAQCVCTFNGENSKPTEIINSNNPQWNDRIVFPVSLAKQKATAKMFLTLSVSNINKVIANDFIGGLKLAIALPLDGEVADTTLPVRRWYPLGNVNRQQELGSDSAEIEIEYRWVENLYQIQTQNFSILKSEMSLLRSCINGVDARVKMLQDLPSQDLKLVEKYVNSEAALMNQQGHGVDIRRFVLELKLVESGNNDATPKWLLCILRAKLAGKSHQICNAVSVNGENVLGEWNGPLDIHAEANSQGEVSVQLLEWNVVEDSCFVNSLGEINLDAGECFKTGEITRPIEGYTVTLGFRSEEALPVDQRASLALVADITGLGISVVDKHPVELLYIGILGFALRLQDSSTQSTVEMSISKFQIDNQTRNCFFPCVLYQPPTSSRDPPKPFLQMSVNMPKFKFEHTLQFQYVSILLQRMNFELEEALVWRLVEFGKEFAVDDSLYSNKEFQSAISLQSIYDAPPASTMQLFIRFLQLQPIAIDISFLADAALRAEQLRGHSFNPIKLTTSIVGNAISSVDGAPMTFNALIVEDLFGPMASITQPIVWHYVHQAITQAYKLVGSLEILGNPIRLVGDLGTGVMDFFYEPAQGLVKSPQDFGIGLARGSMSLVRNTVSGVFSSASKISTNISRGVAMLSLDDEYVKKKLEEQQRKKRAKRGQKLEDHLFSGVVGLGKGAVDGISGILLDPIKGAKKHGVGGFFKGIGTGLLGAVTKPTVGAFDLTTHAFDGIYQTAVMVDSNDYGRLRMPRYIEAGTAVSIFDPLRAEGMNILWEVDMLLGSKVLSKQELDNEKFLDIWTVGSGFFVVASNMRIVGYDSENATDVSGMNPPFNVFYENIVSVVSVKSNLVFTVYSPSRDSGKIHSHKIACLNPDEALTTASSLSTTLARFLESGAVVLNRVQTVKRRSSAVLPVDSRWVTYADKQREFWFQQLQQTTLENGASISTFDRMQERFQRVYRLNNEVVVVALSDLRLGLFDCRSGTQHAILLRDMDQDRLVVNGRTVSLSDSMDLEAVDSEEALAFCKEIKRSMVFFEPRIVDVWIGFGDSWKCISKQFVQMYGTSGSSVGVSVSSMGLKPSSYYQTVFVSYVRGPYRINKTFGVTDAIVL